MSASETGALAAAVAAGLTAGWLASGRPGTVATLAMVMAAVNGYAKSYSP
jgi:hypothetical protein